MEAAVTRLTRQSFLGAESDAVLAAATIGLVGLGGGGSHIAQQAGHAGIGGYVLVDPQTIDFSNTNRLIGGTLLDVRADTAKTAIAARIIRGLNPGARIVEVRRSWHEATEELKESEVIVGCLDTFREREQLERFARSHMIPYIDIGMDVHELGGDHYLIAGQIILSAPGHPCLRCCGFINDETLKREAERYGAAGGRLQVVWPNGVLASTAMGLAMQILTPWHGKVPGFTYLEYDGNKGTVSLSGRVAALAATVCPHHPPAEAGDPLFDIRRHRAAMATKSAAIPQSWWRRLLGRTT